MVEVVENKDKGGLGYQPSFKISESSEAGKRKIPRRKDTFVAKGFCSGEAINAIDDDECAAELSQMVFRTPPGVVPKNWIVKDVTPIISLSK